MGADKGKNTSRRGQRKQTELPKQIEENLQYEQQERERNLTRAVEPQLDEMETGVYVRALEALNRDGVPYLVGAAFARYAYTGIWRKTKDLDLFVRPEHLKQVMTVLAGEGFQGEIRFENWLAKAWNGSNFIDLIFGTGHGHLPISDDMFAGSQPGEVLGVPVQLIPIEEMITSAMYIAGRTRFDGPEVVHLIRASQGKLDWERILRRLGDNRQLLLWHLILFDFVYPTHHRFIPQEMVHQLYAEMEERWQKPARGRRKFRGTLLDPFSYTVDVEDWGYPDPRQVDPLVDEEGGLL